MECHVRSRLKAMVGELAREYQRELEAAGTLVELEELTCEIGDELGRQLCASELANRGERAAEVEWEECPECGGGCARSEMEPTVLEGLRGELGFNQPSYYCRRCRRSFFPDGRPAGAFAARHGDAQDHAADGLGGQQPRQLRDGRRGDA